MKFAGVLLRRAFNLLQSPIGLFWCKIKGYDYRYSHAHIQRRSAQNLFCQNKNKISKVLVMAWWEDDLNDLLKFVAAENNFFLSGL